MADDYMSHQSKVDSPVRHIAAVTPNDSTDLANSSRAIYIGSVSGGSDIKLTTVDGDTVTMTGVAAGAFYPLRVARIWSTGTTATNIQAWW